MRRTHAAAAAIAAAGLSALVSSGLAAVTLYSTGFETADGYTVGSSIHPGNGWTDPVGTTGTAVVSSTAGLAESGTNFILVSPASSVSGNWSERDTQWDGANLAANQVVTVNIGMRLTTAAAGTANRTAIQTVQMYSSDQVIGDVEFIWDSENLVGAGANHLFLFYDWSSDEANPFDSGFGWDFGTFRGSALNLNYGGTNNYLDVSMAVDFSSGDIHFMDSLVGDETEHGTIAVSGSAPFSDYASTDLEWERDGKTTGTQARMLYDNFSVTASPSVPEPASLGLLSVAAAGLIARKRRK